MSEIARQLKIKVNVCSRLTRELQSYETEVGENEAKLQTMREAGRDEYDIKKQQEILQESYMMVPDSRNRLQQAIEDLQQFMDEFGDDPTVVSSDVFAKAQTFLSQT